MANISVKRLIQKLARAGGFEIRRVQPAAAAEIPDAELYLPLYAPWRSQAFQEEYSRISSYTLVSEDRCYILASLVSQASMLDGEVWECGVYRGGTAMLLSNRLSATQRRLRLFDTFEGMPETDSAKDLHKAGDFSSTSLDAVRSRVRGEFVHFHKGRIPDTFRGLEPTQISFAHVDVDIYSAVMACCEFIFPRLCLGGFIVFDDYGFPSCPGARAAVEEYFCDRNAIPLALPTGQGLIFKSGESAITYKERHAIQQVRRS